MHKTLFILAAKWIIATTLFATLIGPNAATAAPGGQLSNTVTLVVRSSAYATFESLFDITHLNLDEVLLGERGKLTEFAPELTDLYVKCGRLFGESDVTIDAFRPFMGGNYRRANCSP